MSKEAMPPMPTRRAAWIAFPAAALLILMSVIGGSRAVAAEGFDWNQNFFGLCQNDCAVSVFGGKQIVTSLQRMFFLNYPPKPAWEWTWRGSEILAGTFSRRLVTFKDALSLEPEVGAGKRFGEMTAGEFWGALVIRWSAFPWNQYVQTSIALSEGISLATQVDTQERLQNDLSFRDGRAVRTGSTLLNYFSPEVTFRLPRYAQYELMFRLQHRSGVFGAINGVHAGSQYGTVGLRTHF